MWTVCSLLKKEKEKKKKFIAVNCSQLSTECECVLTMFLDVWGCVGDGEVVQTTFCSFWTVVFLVTVSEKNRIVLGYNALSHG